MRSDVTTAGGKFLASQHIHGFDWVKRPRGFLSHLAFQCQSILSSSSSLPVHLPHGFKLPAPASLQPFTPNNSTLYFLVSTKILHSKSLGEELWVLPRQRLNKIQKIWLQSGTLEIRRHSLPSNAPLPGILHLFHSSRGCASICTAEREKSEKH